MRKARLRPEMTVALLLAALAFGLVFGVLLPTRNGLAAQVAAWAGAAALGGVLVGLARLAYAQNSRLDVLRAELYRQDRDRALPPSRLSDSYLERQEKLVLLTRTATAGMLSRDEALRQLLLEAGEALRVARASVWMLGPERRSIHCLMLTDGRSGWSSGQSLAWEQAPSYFRALETERLIAAGDAANDPATRELALNYLQPLGITAMLDVPIYTQGRLVGVLCLEHTGPPRGWHPDEQMFGLVVANLISLTLERDERLRADATLRRSETRFRRLVEVMPDAVLSHRDGRIVYCNPAALRLFGAASEAELVGTPMMDRIATASLPQALETMARLEDATASLPLAEIVNVRLDGTEVTVEAISTSFAEDGGTVTLAVLRELTLRKQAEGQLRDNQRFIEQIAATMPDTLYVYDLLQHESVYINRPFARLLGYTSDDLAQMGDEFLTLTLHPEDQRQLRRHHLKFGGEPDGGPVEIEYRMRGKDGQWRWILSRETLFRSTDKGEPWQILGVARDVTERKQAEEALRRSEAEARKLALVASKIDNPVIITGPGGFIEWVNDAFTRLTEYAFAEAVGHKPGRLLQGRDTDPATVELMRQAERDGRGFAVEILNYSKSGRPYWLSIETQPILDENGRLVQFIAVQRDVTALKIAEQERDRFFTLSADIMGILRLDGTFVRVNPAFERVFAWRHNELTGRHFGEVVEPELVPLVEQSFERAGKGEGPLLIEAPFRVAGGAHRWLSIVAVPCLDQGVIYFVGRDVHETKLNEANLSRAKTAAEEASAAKNEFLSRMSHELRTPLNAILGFAQLLDRELLEQEQADSVRQILVAGRHLFGLINEILDISRIESGRMVVSREPVELEQALGEALDLVRPLANDRGIALLCRETPSDVFVLADPQRFKQSLLNLLSNAIKYSASGASVAAGVTALSGGWWRAWVRDTGPGIPADRVERLFQPFDRLGAERSGVEGTGLGLAVARGLVLAMGGRLDFLSEPGRGSTFWIDLPATSPLAEPARIPEDERETEAAPLSATLLYIEDQAANRELIAQVVRLRPNWTLATADTGLEGLREAKRLRPSLILLDVHLPDLDGTEVLRRLHADPTLDGVPVVALSADATGHSQRRLSVNGAAAYITKPIDVSEFLEVVERLLTTR